MRHHQFNGHELGQTPGDSEGQGDLACYSPWGHKESDTTERLHFHFHFVGSSSSTTDESIKKQLKP